MKAQGVTHVVTLLTDEVFSVYGVDGLLDAYQQAGFAVRHFLILDQSVCSLDEMRELVLWIADNLAEGANIMLHCVGGLGRSGLVATCYLISKGLDAEAAIEEVRCVRSPRAIESAVQEAFIRSFASSAA
jgi:protein-tyrosine phosphatase